MLGKRALAYAAQFSGANDLFRAASRRELLVLCYHSVVPQVRDDLSYGNAVTVREFAEQLEILTRFFHPISIRDLHAWLYAGQSIPPGAALITFDDGYRNNCAYAAPLLRRFSVPAAFFLTTSYVGTQRMLWPTEIYWRLVHWRGRSLPAPDGTAPPRPAARYRHKALAASIRERAKRLPPAQLKRYLELLRCGPCPEPDEVDVENYAFMSWDEARELNRAGFDVGSHTASHFTPAQAGSSGFAAEVADSKSRLEQEVGCECMAFAYPNGEAGDLSPDSSRALVDAGLKLAFTTVAQRVSRFDFPLQLGRIGIPSGLSRAEFHTRISTIHQIVRRWAG